MGIAQDSVRVEKVTKVLPETESEQRRVVFLTCCDLVCRSYPYINRVFFFKVGQEVEAAIERLKEGLAKALVSFYPLAGRFCVDEEGRLQVECGNLRLAADENAAAAKEGGGGSGAAGGCGAEFVQASCDLPFATLARDGFQYHQVFWKLARRTHYLRCDYLHEPLLSVQVTRFRDGGGLSVGVSMSHALADAQSFYDFVKCWGELCRGLSMTVPPMHMRAALSVNALFPTEPLSCSQAIAPSSIISCEKPQQQIFSVCEPKLKPLPGTDKDAQKGVSDVNELVEELEQMGIVGKAPVRSAGQDANPSAPRTRAPVMEKQLEDEEHRRPRPDLVQKVFSFSAEKLQRLKQRVNSEQEMKKKGCAAQMGPEVCSKLLSDEVRKAVNPQSFTTFETFCAHWWQCFIRARCLPVGQPVFLLIPINCRQRFLDLPQSYFGNALDGALVMLTAGELCGADLPAIAGKIHKAIKAATEEGFKQYIKEAEGKKNGIPHFDRTGLFHIVDSPKYPVYDVDFGFGTPEAVRAEGFRFGAEVQILAGRLGPGSYDLFCALDADVMHRLEHDSIFLAL